MTLKHTRPHVSRLVMVIMSPLMIAPSALGADDAVETYKTQSFVWQFNRIFIELDTKNKNYCRLADSYDEVEVDLRRVARDKYVLGKGGKTYTFTASDVRRLEDFGDSIAVLKRSADRQCRG